MTSVAAREGQADAVPARPSPGERAGRGLLELRDRVHAVIFAYENGLVGG